MLFAFAGLSILAATVQAAPFTPFTRRDGLADVKGNCNQGFAYTFDDGPYIYHDEILDKFDSYGFKTTFFVNGNNWSCIYDEDNVEALRRTFEEGHQIASHTWSHASLLSLTDSGIDSEIQRLDEALVKILGVRPKFFRPPYGDINDHTAAYIQDVYGKTVVLWSDDSGDSTGGDANGSYQFYSSLANNGPNQVRMTLSHETEDAAIGAIRMGSVDVLAQHGISLITVSQCLDISDMYEVVGGYGTRDDTWTCDGDFTPTSPGSGGSTPTTTSTSPSQTCAAQYTSVAGDTCDSIGAKYGISGSAILAANTFLTCSDIWANTPICIPSIGSTPPPTTTTTATTTPPPSQTCAAQYTSVAGDTCDSIGAKYGISGSAILAANTFLTCSDIWAYTPICIPSIGSVSSSTPTTTASSAGSQPSCVSTYTSAAGDTCDSIGAKYGLSGDAILAANTFLTCSDIWTYTPICIPPGGAPPSTTCTQTISSQAGDTCASIGAQHGVSADQILAWNTFLDCNDIWTNTPVCVAH